MKEGILPLTSQKLKELYGKEYYKQIYANKLNNFYEIPKKTYITDT